MKKLLFSLAIIAVTLCASTAPAVAAQLYSGNSVSFPSSKTLTDAYVAGSTVDITVPTQGDLVVAGSSVNLNSTISQDLLAAGSTVVFNGQVGHTARIAGGDVTINGTINSDLVVAGGTVNISSAGHIRGDLIVAGGTVQLNAPVDGKVLAYGGDVTINSHVHGNIEGQIQQLTLGSNAIVDGDITYHGDQELAKQTGAVVHGTVLFTQINHQPQINAADVFAKAIYGLISSLIITFLLVYLFNASLPALFSHAQTNPFKSFIWGACVIVLTPIVILIAGILSIWLSLVLLLLYLLLILISWFMAQVYLGYWLLRWWHSRNHHDYTLDWQSAVIGSIAATILLLVPILGWLVMLILWWLLLGATAAWINTHRSPAALSAS